MMMPSTCKLPPQKIPSFKEVWEDVKGDDKWSNLIDEKFDELSGSDEDDDEVDEEDENDENDENDVSIKNEKRLKKKAEEDAKDEAEESYKDIVDTIAYFCSEGKNKIMLYRSMLVKNINRFIDDLKKTGKTTYRNKEIGVGIYWAWDIEHAISHAGEAGKEIILEAIADCNDIDYEGTIEAYMIYSADNFDETANENEIRLIENVQVSLKTIYVNVANYTFCQKSGRMTKNTIKIDMKGRNVWT